jgi:hypothetical protein
MPNRRAESNLVQSAESQLNCRCLSGNEQNADPFLMTQIPGRLIPMPDDGMKISSGSCAKEDVPSSSAIMEEHFSF